MMKLSLMRDIFETVNSDWDCAIAAELLKNWNHDKDWVKMWRASANVICFTRYQEEYFVLRFNYVSEKNKEDWDAEIHLLNLLETKGLKVVEPVHSKNKVYIETQETQWGCFHAALFRKIPGDQYDMEDLNPEQFFQWGESLGQLHRAMQEIAETQKIKRKTHPELLQELREDFPPANSAEEREFEWARDWLESLPEDRKNTGLIHYDFELDNLLWQDEGIHIIDFDDALYSRYTADIAYALRDLFDDGASFNPENEHFKTFLKGYRSIKDISDRELVLIPGFYRIGNLVSLKKLEHSIDLDLSEENPDWLNDLIRKLTGMKENCKNRMRG